jgi:hypothetical protein
MAMDRSTSARIAANERWSKEPDRSAGTAAARAARDKRFEDQVDPDRTLPPAERAKRVKNARTAYFLRLNAASHEARQAKRTAGGAA